MKNPFKKVEAQCCKTLANQAFSNTQPGSILGDIQTMIDFIGPAGLRTGSELGNVPSPLLTELNERLSQPIKTQLKRALMRDYPNIAGLFILLRVMNLVRVEEEHLSVVPESYSFWANLSPAEKYFALIEAWLFFAESGVVSFKKERWHRPQALLNLSFLTGAKSSVWTRCDSCFHLYERPTGLQAWNTQLQMRFGLVDLLPWPPKQPRSDRGWAAGAYRRTSWGTAFLWCIFESYPDYFHEYLEINLLPDDPGYGMIQQAFGQVLPDCKRAYLLPRKKPAPALYIFRVELDPEYYGKGTWRSLAVPSRSTLANFALGILASFKFDDENAYEFEFRDNIGKTRTFGHPGGNDGPFADEVRMGDLDLCVNQTITFQYGRGDDWKFNAILERIDPPNPEIKGIKLLDKHGPSPKQYPDSDADW